MPLWGLTGEMSHVTHGSPPRHSRISLLIFAFLVVPFRAETINVGNTIEAREHVTQWNNSLFVLQPNSSAEGKVVRWELFANRTGNVTFQVWQPVDAEENLFSLVGLNNFTVSTLGHISFPVVNPDDFIDFRSGYAIGLYFPEQDPVPYTLASECRVGLLFLNDPCPFSRCRRYYFRAADESSSNDTNDVGNGCRIYSISATIQADDGTEATNGSVFLDGLDNATSSENVTSQDVHDWTAPSHNGSNDNRTAVKPSTLTDVRLLHGRGVNEGHVQLAVQDGVWGHVCEDGWGDNEAAVVCRMMGYQYGFARHHPFFGVADSSWDMRRERFNCSGEEHSLRDCDPQLDEEWLGADSSPCGGVAGVICLPHTGHVVGYPAVQRTHRHPTSRPSINIYLLNPSQYFPWASGRLQSWHFYVDITPNTTISISLQIWRRVTSEEFRFRFVAETKLRGLTLGRHVYFTAGEENDIHLEAGDVIGVQATGTNPVPYDVYPGGCSPADSLLISSGYVKSGSLQSGDVLDFGTDSPDHVSDCRIYSAYVTYSVAERPGSHHFSIGHSSYKVLPLPVTSRLSALRNCVQSLGPGATLANITSPREFFSLVGILNTLEMGNNLSFWISGYPSDYRDPQAEWIQGRWGPCQPRPGQHCLLLRRTFSDMVQPPETMAIYSAACHTHHAAICEREYQAPLTRISEPSTLRPTHSLDSDQDLFLRLLREKWIGNWSQLAPQMNIAFSRSDLMGHGVDGGLIAAMAILVTLTAILTVLGAILSYRRWNRYHKYPNDVSEATIRFIALADS